MNLEMCLKKVYIFYPENLAWKHPSLIAYMQLYGPSVGSSVRCGLLYSQKCDVTFVTAPAKHM